MDKFYIVCKEKAIAYYTALHRMFLSYLGWYSPTLIKNLTNLIKELFFFV